MPGAASQLCTCPGLSSSDARGGISIVHVSRVSLALNPGYKINGTDSAGGRRVTNSDAKLRLE